MSKSRPTYQELEKRLAAAEPIVEALQHHEVDAVVGEGKVTLLLLQKVEEALIDSEAGFQAMFNLSGVGMAQAETPALRFTKVNQKLCEILGYSGGELLRTYLGLTHAEDQHRDMKTLAEVLRGKADSWSIEKRCIRKDRSIAWVRVDGTVLRDAARRAVKILVMVTDLTAGKQAERQHRSAEKELKKRIRELTAELTQRKGTSKTFKKAAARKAHGTTRTKSSDRTRHTR